MIEAGMVSDLVREEKDFSRYALDQAQTLRTHGHLLFALGDLAGAEASYWKSLALKKEVLGAYHLDVAECLEELAELYEFQNNPTESFRFYEFAHAVKERVLGEFHPVVLRSARKLSKLRPRKPVLAVAS